MCWISSDLQGCQCLGCIEKEASTSCNAVSGPGLIVHKSFSACKRTEQSPWRNEWHDHQQVFDESAALHWDTIYNLTSQIKGIKRNIRNYLSPCMSLSNYFKTMLADKTCWFEALTEPFVFRFVQRSRWFVYCLWPRAHFEAELNTATDISVYWCHAKRTHTNVSLQEAFRILPSSLSSVEVVWMSSTIWPTEVMDDCTTYPQRSWLHRFGAQWMKCMKALCERLRNHYAHKSGMIYWFLKSRSNSWGGRTVESCQAHILH